MNRRVFLAVGVEVVTIGCLGARSITAGDQPRTSSTSTSSTSTSSTSTDGTRSGGSSWGALSIGNVSPSRVRVTLTVEDVERPSEAVVTFTDTVTLGPDDHGDHSHTHEKKSTTYTEIPVNRPSHTHRVTIDVEDGPRGHKRFRPANMDSDLSVSVAADEVVFRSVVEGPGQ